MITGRAISIERKLVKSPCGFEGLAGYKTTEGKHGSDAVLSFMPKTHKVAAKVTTLDVAGKQAEVVKQVPSQHIIGMWTFFIKYQE